MVKKASKNRELPNERIFKLLASIDSSITNIEERLSDMATKANLDYTRNKLEDRINEVKLDIRALGRAVDKDSLAVLDFEKRIVRLEKREAVQ
ncbi:MAG TPA: hypothetical protein VJH69_01170 [Candidatus Paceibacterota bacterium]